MYYPCWFSRTPHYEATAQLLRFSADQQDVNWHSVFEVRSSQVWSRTDGLHGGKKEKGISH